MNPTHMLSAAARLPDGSAHPAQLRILTTPCTLVLRDPELSGLRCGTVASDAAQSCDERNQCETNLNFCWIYLTLLKKTSGNSGGSSCVFSPPSFSTGGSRA